MIDENALVLAFLKQAQPRYQSVITDYIGTGQASIALILQGMQVRLHDPNEPPVHKSPYGVAAFEDVPDQVISNVLLGALHVFFWLEEHSFGYWLRKLQDFDCAVHWAKEFDGFSCFYVTAWPKCEEIIQREVVNTADETISRNIEANLKAGWSQVGPHVQPDGCDECMIVGGSPSANDYVHEIARLQSEGVKLFTLNGAYGWCLERDIKPHGTIVVDARPFNSRFVRPVIQTHEYGGKPFYCTYLIASQCDPSVFEGLPKDHTAMWHSPTEGLAKLLNKYLNEWYVIQGGTTVFLQSLLLLRLIGFRRFHVFGVDSCLIGEKHHAYEQKENDGQTPVSTMVGNREFLGHLWMLSQAEQFIELVKTMDDEINMEFYGDGLLKAILVHAAQLAVEN